MDGSDLVFVIPLWRRVCNISRVIDAVKATTPAAHILFVVSIGDKVTAEFALAVTEPSVTVQMVAGDGGGQGDYAKKINVGYRVSWEPYIFTGADDVVPQPGWYEAARSHMRDGIGVVGTVDGTNNRTMDGRHSTHSLVARWYADQGACVDQDHVIYHEGYWHEWCDDELVRTAMSRNAYAHAFSAVVDHVHWNRDRTLMDDVYRHGKSHSALSRRLFMKRRHLWGEYPKGIRQARRVTR